MIARLITPFAASAALLLAGCASTTPDWDARFGSAARATLASQVVVTAAPTRAPQSGIDGVAARAAQLHYEQSFIAPQPPPPSLSIGIGGTK